MWKAMDHAIAFYIYVPGTGRDRLRSLYQSG